MKLVGILGLPRSGKTTLFEILMQGAGHHPAGAAARDVVGVVRVPDPRLERLAALVHPKKTTWAQIEFVDSAAAGHGGRAGKGPDLFAGVRTCDALLAVVRDFENPAVPAERGVAPDRDLRDLEAELILNDLAIVENRLERIERELKVGQKQDEAEHGLLARCRELIEAETPLRAASFDPEEEKRLRGFHLLTLKPLLVVYNQDERSTRTPPPPGPRSLAVTLRAEAEREIVALPPGERDAFRVELGVKEDGLSLVIRACYEVLGLISFFTLGHEEARAWTLRRGESAVDAAGEIHTDMARGFIRAEVVSWERLLEAGGKAKAREKAWLRLERREYEVQDGDCLEIRFNK